MNMMTIFKDLIKEQLKVLSNTNLLNESNILKSY